MQKKFLLISQKVNSIQIENELSISELFTHRNFYIVFHIVSNIRLNGFKLHITLSLRSNYFSPLTEKKFSFVRHPVFFCSVRRLLCDSSTKHPYIALNTQTHTLYFPSLNVKCLSALCHLHKTSPKVITLLTWTWKMHSKFTETKSIKVKNIIKSLKCLEIKGKKILFFFDWHYFIVWFFGERFFSFYSFIVCCEWHLVCFVTQKNAKNIITALKYVREHWTWELLLFWRIDLLREAV